jgi:rhodanese-related sulfurtransferase
MAVSVIGSFAQVPAPMPDDKTYEFGLIPIGTVINHTFILKNTGKKTLALSGVTASCDCTKVTSFPKRIAPGDQGEIVAVMDHRHAGYTDIAINVQTGPALQALYTFHLIGVLVDKPKENSASPEQITAKDAMQLQATSKTVTLVDVRPINLYVQVHAKGAQNVQPFPLEARLDLKSRSIILIGAGANDPSLSSRIDHLKSLGFKDVRFVTGGLRSWQMAGGLLEGAALPQSANLALLSPSEFYADQKGGASWLVINVDEAGVKEAFPTIYPIKNLPLKGSPSSFAKALRSASTSQNFYVLITSSIGTGYDQIETALRGNKFGLPVYYLEGGSRAYATYVQQQMLELAVQKITVRGDQAYLASSRTTGQVVRGAGCSSCGH